jgi:hypothetical protein
MAMDFKSGVKSDDTTLDTKWKKKGKTETGSVKSMKSGDAGAEATEKSHDVTFAKGGKTPMFGEQSAGPEKPGTTAHDVTGGVPGPSFADGGKTAMFGYQGSVPATAGQTSAR